MGSKSKILINVSLFLLIFLFCVNFAVAQAQDLNEFQKETIASIREITLQLILIAMGVFALLGGFATARNRTFRARSLIWVAFSLLGASVAMGLLAYGNLIWTLGKGLFEPFKALRILAMLQWIFFGVGGLIFGLFVLLNLRQNEHEQEEG